MPHLSKKVTDVQRRKLLPINRTLANVTLLFFLLVATLFRSARADFEASYQGFLKTYDNYRTNQISYITARNQFLTFGTLISQNEALAAVKNFMLARNDVLMSYISLLRERKVADLYKPLLDEEYTLLSDHKNRVPAVGSLQDAVKISKEVESRHIPFQTTSRKIVSSLLLQKVLDLHTRYQLLALEAGKLIETLKAQEKDVTSIERWLLDAKGKELLAEQKIQEAGTLVESLTSSNLKNLTEEYNQIQFTIFEANQYIKEALDFLNELSDSIKYGKF